MPPPAASRRLQTASSKRWHCRLQRVYLWTSLVSIVSCLVGVVALGSPSWTEGPYGHHEYLQTGLLLFCHHRDSQPKGWLCAPLLFGTHQVWFEAVRLLSLLSWIFLFTVLVLSFLLHFLDDLQTFSLPLIILGLTAGLLGVVASIVFVVSWTTQTVLEKYDVSISWGYAVNVIWHVITLFLFCCLCVASRDIWHIQLKLKRLTI